MTGQLKLLTDQINNEIFLFPSNWGAENKKKVDIKHRFCDLPVFYRTVIRFITIIFMDNVILLPFPGPSVHCLALKCYCTIFLLDEACKYQIHHSMQ